MATELNTVSVSVTSPLSGAVRLPQSTTEENRTLIIVQESDYDSHSLQLNPVVPSGQTQSLSELGVNGVGQTSTHSELL